MSRQSNHIPMYLTNDFNIDINSPSGLVWKNPARKKKNDRYALQAGSYNKKTGYWQVRINHPDYKGTNFFVYVHRLVWMIANKKEIPEGMVIDHKQGKSNHPDNLRLATNKENTANIKLPPRKSGLPHRVHRAGTKFFGTFNYKGVRYTSVVMETIEEAEAWVKAKVAEVHGEFCYAS